jgi:hypothetical protein
MTLQDAKDEDLEWHAWPPRPVGGQQVGGHRAGVLVVHKPTGIAKHTKRASNDEEHAIKHKTVSGCLMTTTPTRIRV